MYLLAYCITCTCIYLHIMHVHTMWASRMNNLNLAFIFFSGVRYHWPIVWLVVCPPDAWCHTGWRTREAGLGGWLLPGQVQRWTEFCWRSRHHVRYMCTYTVAHSSTHSPVSCSYTCFITLCYYHPWPLLHHHSSLILHPISCLLSSLPSSLTHSLNHYAWIMNVHVHDEKAQEYSLENCEKPAATQDWTRACTYMYMYMYTLTVHHTKHTCT